MVGTPEQFVKAYPEMVDAARKTYAWKDWKPSEAFCKYLDADWDRVFGSDINLIDKSDQIHNG